MKTSKQIENELSWLGQVIKINTIEDFQVATLLEKDFDSGEITKKVAYYPFYKGSQNSNGYSSMAEALVGIIATSRDGLNTEADKYFFKMTK